MTHTEARPIRHRKIGVVLAAALVVALVAGCGGGGGGGGRGAAQSPAGGASRHGGRPAAQEPPACRGLTPVRTTYSDTIPWSGAFPPSESFDAWSPGAPFVVATLEDNGLHFSPDEVAGGLYNVCFVDARADRTHADDVVLDFCFCAGPLLTTLSVKAGTIGSGMLCPISAQVDVSVDDKPAHLPSPPTSLSIAPRADCPTGWT